MTLLTPGRINNKHFHPPAYYISSMFIQPLVGGELLKLNETRPIHRAGDSNAPDDINALMNSDPRHRPSRDMTTSPT